MTLKGHYALCFKIHGVVTYLFSLLLYATDTVNDYTGCPTSCRKGSAIAVLVYWNLKQITIEETVTVGVGKNTLHRAVSLRQHVSCYNMGSI